MCKIYILFSLFNSGYVNFVINSEKYNFYFLKTLEIQKPVAHIYGQKYVVRLLNFKHYRRFTNSIHQPPQQRKIPNKSPGGSSN